MLRRTIFKRRGGNSFAAEAPQDLDRHGFRDILCRMDLHAGRTASWVGETPKIDPRIDTAKRKPPGSNPGGVLVVAAVAISRRA